MATKGYNVTQLDDPRNQVELRLRGASLSDSAAMNSLAAFEIPIAVADFDCQTGTVIPVRQALEQKEVAKLKAQFPQYGDR